MTPAPFNHGAPWTDVDYNTLVDMLREGCSCERIADQLGRNDGGIRSACGRLLPDDPSDIPDQAPARGHVERLRAVLLADEDYDWRAPLDNQTRGVPHWSEARDEALTAGWRERRPMDWVTAATQATESAVYSRLVELGLASSVQEVVDRLGCVVPGVLNSRLLFAKDRESASAWVLVITGLTIRSARGLPHITLHPSEEYAEWALQHLLFDHCVKRGTPVEEVQATLAERIPDGTTAGVVRVVDIELPAERPPRLPPGELAR